MPNILTVHRVLYVLLAFSSLTLLCISTWTLVDPVIRAFYYNITIKGYRLPEKADTWHFFVISIVTLLGSAQLLIISILALWANAKRLCLFRIVTWYNLVLISFTIAGIVLVATNSDVNHKLKLKSVLSRIMEYKEAEYDKSVENSQFMDTVQQIVGCCGVINADVYVKTASVPSSCGKMYGVGCLEKSLSYLDERLKIFAALHGTTLIIQISTLIVSCFVPVKTKKPESSWSPNSNRSRSPYSSRSRSLRSIKY